VIGAKHIHTHTHTHTIQSAEGNLLGVWAGVYSIIELKGSDRQQQLLHVMHETTLFRCVR